MNILDKMELQNDLAVKSTGFNQWDEEWEVGGYTNASGEKYNTSDRIRSKNFIRVFPSTQYYFNTPNTIYVFKYDANKNYLGYNTTGNQVFVMPDNCYYINIVNTYATTYNNDICINISDPAKNGTYLPYQASTQDLSWIYDLEYTPSGSETSEKLFPYGLLSAGSVHDEVTESGAIKRIGMVDLGKLSWQAYSSAFPNVWANYTLLDGAATVYYSYVSNILSNKYTAVSWATLFDQNAANSIAYRNISNNYYLCCSSGESTQPSGYLMYELATPITITFDSPKSMGYNVQTGGTEELLPTNTASASPITAPIIESVVYPLDAVGTLVNLPKNYISVSSMDSFTTALGNQLNLNITKTWDATNNKWSFSVTARN